jgi:hypothetical protein
MGRVQGDEPVSQQRRHNMESSIMKKPYEALMYVKNNLNEAIDTMHETGDVESELLDLVSAKLTELERLIASQTEFQGSN